MTLFHLSFLTVTLWDVLDVLLVGFLFYKLMQMLRGTRAVPMVFGVLILFLVAWIAQVLQLGTVSWIIEGVGAVWLIAFVIIFQPELRRILVILGQSRLVRYFVKVEEPQIVDEICTAVERMSRKGIGALIVLTREVGLKTVQETGVRLDAEVSSALLESIFFPRSPLHDGAVLIQDGVITAASCLLPLSQSTRLEEGLGTRHRAAAGVTEESDAVVVVVSEENSIISLAVGGRLTRNLDAASLRQQLLSLLGPRGAVSAALPEVSAA